MSKNTSAKLEQGVVYKDTDYAGLFSRLVILVTDSLVVLTIMFVSDKIDDWLYLNYFVLNNYAIYSGLFVSYIYLTAVKASRFGTIGQILTKTEILTIYGGRPGQFRMTIRLFFWMLGPINFLTDLIFLTFVKERRTIRDCYCDTIVVKRNSTPVTTTAPVRATRAFALGLNLMYRSCYSEYS